MPPLCCQEKMALGSPSGSSWQPEPLFSLSSVFLLMGSQPSSRLCTRVFVGSKQAPAASALGTFPDRGLSEPHQTNTPVFASKLGWGQGLLEATWPLRWPVPLSPSCLAQHSGYGWGGYFPLLIFLSILLMRCTPREPNFPGPHSHEDIPRGLLSCPEPLLWLPRQAPLPFSPHQAALLQRQELKESISAARSQPWSKLAAACARAFPSPVLYSPSRAMGAW